MSTKYKGTLIAFVICAVINTYAADKGSLHISSMTSVAGKQLAPGDYSVRWDGSGPDVELEIVHGKTIVATAPATMLPINDELINNSVIVTTYEDGSRSVSQILIAGKRFVFKISSQSNEAELKTSN